MNSLQRFALMSARKCCSSSVVAAAATKVHHRPMFLGTLLPWSAPASRAIRTPAGFGRGHWASGGDRSSEPEVPPPDPEATEKTAGQSTSIGTFPLKIIQGVIAGVLSRVDDQIRNGSYGRLFCVVQMGEHQHKLTSGDLLMCNHDVGAPVGSRILLEKLLLIGSKDFTLLGRPLLPKDLFRVEATVVEKNLSQVKVLYFFHRRRKNRREKTRCKEGQWK